MMIQIVGTSLFLLIAASAFSNQKQMQQQPDSIAIEDFTGKNLNQTDTLFKTEINSNPLLSYQNLIYKLRLDSIERSIPLSYNEHVQKYIDLYSYSRKEQIGNMLGLSDYYFPIFERSLREVGVPEEIKYISVIESALNPHAVSRSGAVGPWQFMFTTAKGYGLKMDSYVDERKDPVQASIAAALYLKDAYKRFGDWLLAIAAYNCGSGAVARAITRSGGQVDFWKIRSFLPRETQNYVPAFIATVYVMNYYAKHDIFPREANFSIVTDVIDVNRVVSFSSIAKAANIDLNELRLLNPSYKKQIINGSAASPKRLVIPSVGKQLYASLYDVLNSTEILSGAQMTAVSNTGSNKNKAGLPESHQVHEGQTLLMVANQYGVEVQDLKVYNNLQNTQIVPGQSIRLKPERINAKANPPRYIIYMVRAGDTLSEIAAKFSGATTLKIKALNGLKRNTLHPGMKLKINKG